MSNSNSNSNSTNTTNRLPVLQGDTARQVDLDVTDRLGRERVLEGVATRIADTLLYHLDTDSRRRNFLFVAGKGNNGANAIAAARMLHMRGMHNTQVVTLVDPTDDVSNFRPNVQEQIDLYRHFAGAANKLFPLDLERIRSFRDGIIVDGILGTGIADPPRGVSQQAIQAINEASSSAVSTTTKVLSIDMPSGLNHVNGQAPGVCVQATWTLNLHMLKLGQLQPAARPFIGELYSAETGLGFSTFPDDLESAFIEFYKDGPIRKVELVVGEQHGEEEEDDTPKVKRINE